MDILKSANTIAKNFVRLEVVHNELEACFQIDTDRGQFNLLQNFNSEFCWMERAFRCSK